MRSALSVLSRQCRSRPLLLPVGQLIPQHALAVDKFTPRLCSPPKVAGLVSPWRSLSFSGAGGKGDMAAPRKAGLPKEHTDALPSQLPTAGQYTLTPGILAAEPQLPR